MKESIITNFSDLHSFFSGKERTTIFRGHSNSEWALKPKAGRESYDITYEKQALDFFKLQSVNLVDQNPRNDWEWLALAQHYGIATRLLDWTFNPLIATFFAVVKSENNDAAVYKFDYTKVIVEKHDPFKVEYVAIYKPRAITNRIVAQQSIFTFHSDPEKSFEESPAEGNIERIVISKEYREKLKFELEDYGFNYLSVFQDLQGLADYVDWRWINRKT